MKRDILVDLDSLLSENLIKENTFPGHTPEEVAARIDLVQKFNVDQADVDNMTTAQVLKKYKTKLSTKGIDFETILQEWAWRCEKGYPSMKDGKFINKKEIEILNEILTKLNFPTIDVKEAIQLSTNPTDIKEGMVCLFIDAGLSDKSIFETYRQGLNKKLSPEERTTVVEKIRTKLGDTAKKFGQHYGVPNYAKMGDYVAECLSDIKTYKTDIVTINNGVAAAEAVLKAFNAIQPGMVRRDNLFEAIRSHAVSLIESNYGLKGYYPDNWCPGDIYIIQNESEAKKALTSTTLNIGKDSLNNYFYGSNNSSAPIIAISLKMQMAQAGKATTFIKNVVVDGVTPADKLGKDKSNQNIIKFRDIQRRLEKYYLKSDLWKTDTKIFGKVRQAITQLAKIGKIGNLPVKLNQTSELETFLNEPNSKSFIEKQIEDVNKQIGQSTNVATAFQQAYTRFVKGLKSMNIEKVGGDSREFLKAIESQNAKLHGGEVNQPKLQAILSQKAATYDLASNLIEKWTEKTKKVSPAFADYLAKVKNPFIAITMFAIAQHGLNPSFYKAIGRNDGGTGTISEFPSNSVVDETKSVQKLEVVDSPGQAGFYISYLLTINNHTYKTRLVFRFSKDQIRVEVEELSAL